MSAVTADGSASQKTSGAETQSKTNTMSVVECDGAEKSILSFRKGDGTSAEAPEATTQATAQKLPMTEEGVDADSNADADAEAGREGEAREDLAAASQKRYAKDENVLYGVPRKRTKISWKCGMCGYHVLAMDQEGRPLPLSVSSFGEVLPMTCPRCLLEHTSWEQAVPFDEYGDHANIRSKLSNNYARTTGNAGAEMRDVTPVHTTRATGVAGSSPEIPPILQEIGRKLQQDAAGHMPMQPDPKPRGRRMAYYCRKCNRQLLRIDPYGELVPLARDKDGSVLPIVCPGCKVEHNEWDVRSFTVTL
ncbi:uncharacterized protein Tco025E_01703 [Trypanosoma conorhini]|uniref:Uncharacterized protein n=1 Tax=Trypanosoma conorhini TaxID=83891 RepID=A0A3R7LF71_9TRYP|nr:uncharacterized protein Tco025E_01703 [Trypanosoma conorhini]RNF26074.1 hypothetical protein Tco025E_01703 [Trypanosoma conorhini]